ncbi:MAG: NADH-quinone oxidoreductase subunit N [Myxococcales bacterium]|nr:NADH-quinone oxidoreductase subunit N [Myxococcales bacterium]
MLAFAPSNVPADLEMAAAAAAEAAQAAPTMSGQALVDMVHLAPMMLIGLWAIIDLVADAFAHPGTRAHQKALTMIGVVLALVVSISQFGSYEYDGGVEVFSGFMVVDQFSILLDIGIIVVAGAVIMFGNEYCRAHRFEYGEHEALVLIAAFGMMILGHSNDLVALFLGIETMSIAVYVMVGARWNSRQSPEAALKYFIMGAFASGLLLMGIALVYGATGVTGYDQLGHEVSTVFTKWGAAQPYVKVIDSPEGVPASVIEMARDKVAIGIAPAALLIPGVLLILGGLLFKVSAAPFHMWTPDAYEGAPSPTTAFMAAGVKIGGFAGMLKLFVGVLVIPRLVEPPYGWGSVVLWLAVLTMVVGNLAAVKQTNVKRLLAYSSVAHVGYILVGVVAAASFYGDRPAGGYIPSADEAEWAMAAGDTAVASVVFYVLTYAVATLGAFACVSWLGRDKKEATSAHEWSGLAVKHPGMALGMTICLLALMGMPPTAGFFGKLFVFRSAFEHSDPTLRIVVVIALVNSVIGAVYYLRLIVSMYFRPPLERDIGHVSGAGAPVVLAASAALSLLMGLGANAVMQRCELAAAGFRYPVGEAKADRVDALRAVWEQRDAEADAKARGQEEPTAVPAGGPEDAAADAPAADGADGEAIPVEGKAAAPAPGGVPRGPAPRGPAIKLDPAPAH